MSNWKNRFPKENIYFETSNGILYCGNSLEIVKEFPNECINLILTDPPYQISKPHNFHTLKDRKNKRRGTYFGEWDVFDVLKWKLFLRLVEENGSIVSFMSFEQYGKFAQVLNEEGFIIKDRLIWEKTNPFPRNRDRRYIPNIELIVWATRKQAKWTFNRQNSKYECCVLRFPSESGARFKRYHPTQKPIALIKYLLKIHSNPNDKILDPFIGVGTTAIACERLNRRWIGIEINPKYCEIAKQRIVEFLKQPKRKTLL